jgi:DNA (cytosine-5)-methyltransferase 1
MKNVSMTQTIDDTENADRLSYLVGLYGLREVARRLARSTRTIERWAGSSTALPLDLDDDLTHHFGRPVGRVNPEESASSLRFADLFAGIGGIRLGLESSGGECVFTSEWDKFAVQTYAANHKSDHQIVGDINLVDVASIPDHDILAGGFPCQPFSLAGVSKKNSLGRSHGFMDAAQGTLFFNVAEIIAVKQPRAFLLENVKNLLSHDRGNTFRVVKTVLEDELGYTLHWKVLDAKGYVPQHRERILMVGFRDGGEFDWESVKPQSANTHLKSILHPEDGTEAVDSPYVDTNGRVSEKYVLSDRLWAYLQAYAAKHRAAGNGFGFGLINPESYARTLSARYYKDGSEILVPRGRGQNPRRLTPRECARLMGFDDSFEIPVSDTQAYKQFGNSVVVPVIASVSQELARQLAGTRMTSNGTR